MESEKFDESLRLIVLANDEHIAPSFNGDKVWKNTRRDGRRKLAAAIVSIAAIIIMVLSILLNNKPSGKKDEPGRLSKTMPVVAGRLQEELKHSKEIPERKSMEKAPVVELQRELLVESQLPYSEQLAVSSAEKDNLQDTLPTLSVAQMPVRGIPANSSEEVKITFVRGGNEMAATMVPDLRITFRKGSTVRTYRRETSPDSTYYADRNPFKLKFRKN